MKATVKAPGTCGELVQGTIDNINFHVTCPINKYSYVTVELASHMQETICKQELPKTVQAVNKTLDYFGIDNLKAIINVRSELITGKGMASSTADITAAILATVVALGEEISSEELTKLALSVEPTDGVFYDGIVLFDHVSGKLYRYLGQISGLSILMVDLGGKIDTLQFNSRNDLKELNKDNEPLTKQALKLIEEGINKQNLDLVGKGVTLSSKANQNILPKKNFNKFLSLTNLEGVLGLNVAHSGTLLGILYDAKQIRVNKIEDKVKKRIGHFNMEQLKLINGGLTIIDDSSDWERKYKYG
ncbi:GHMP family kinase ATP-binding protein [Selenihalanaerobacter shriftii]|nr:kinase [Selenihalanaerobacter shriftii]